MPSLMLEVEENRNCEGMSQLVFSTVASPREITHIKTARTGTDVSFHLVTGWCSGDGGSPCPAYAVPVDDSGSGRGLLVYGGDWGLRLMPPEVEEAWDLESPSQWGESYLVLNDESEVRYA